MHLGHVGFHFGEKALGFAFECVESVCDFGFGAAVARSQSGAECALHNQIPETIALVRGARALGAVAASAFGAGFGGSVWALVERARVEEFRERWSEAYRVEFPGAAARAEFFVTGAGPAATRLA